MEVESIEGKKPTQNYDDETTSKRNYVRPERVGGGGIWQKPNQAQSSQATNTTHSEWDDGKEKKARIREGAPHKERDIKAHSTPLKPYSNGFERAFLIYRILGGNITK